MTRDASTVTDHWFNTNAGNKFSYVDMDPNSIDILDIAHALSQLCRYNGHISEFYSVAQHSVIVSRAAANIYLYRAQEGKLEYIPQERLMIQMWGLLHDATEAYMGDMVRPLKEMMPQYKEMEDRLDDIIMNKFVGSPIPDRWHELIKEADNRTLVTESRQLVPVVHKDWSLPWEPLDDGYLELCWTPGTARAVFLRDWYNLVEVRGQFNVGK